MCEISFCFRMKVLYFGLLALLLAEGILGASLAVVSEIEEEPEQQAAQTEQEEPNVGLQAPAGEPAVVDAGNPARGFQFPGGGGVGQPMLPGGGGVGQPMLPGGGGVGQPMLPGGGGVGQPMLPGGGGVGQPFFPGGGGVGQPLVLVVSLDNLARTARSTRPARTTRAARATRNHQPWWYNHHSNPISGTAMAT